MLMSAVSAEENMTIAEESDSASDYVELDSDQSYDENNISDNSVMDDDVIDDENISKESIKQNDCPTSLDGRGAPAGKGFNGIAYASASSNKDVSVHKSSSSSHFSKGDAADVRDNEYSVDGMLSNFKSLDAIGVGALNDIIPAENLFEDTYSSYREYFDYLKLDLLENVIEDLIINSYDLTDEMELFMESDSNISDMLIIQDNRALMNQTFELNTMPDVSVNSYDTGPDLELSDDAGCLHDAHDKTIAIQSFKFSQPVNRLSDSMSQDIQHAFYHTIGCECTNPNFTKQNNSYDNLPKVSESDTVTNAEQEDNHDWVLFKKYNVNSPFIVENTSVFALFGVIEITIP